MAKKTKSTVTTFFGWASFLSSVLILLYFLVIYAYGYPWSIILNVILKLLIIPVISLIIFIYYKKKR